MNIQIEMCLDHACFFSESETIYIIRVRAKNRKGQGLEALERVTIPRLSK